ncbi:SUF system NifU family Fe-S cluster assembly protein [Candidatus Peregrinibacteria bacterium HGW-Peregrinibacteria-1]|jgi:nitrogen fixation NifU-like protein|nr:MAG: SUF system NifU family Fe-S cluster assembly protein [Candidatus Peregrinibacteria bacterium HGW-Peregrinibacteria-1]
MDLYSEIILDYYKNPRNKTLLETANKTATEFNSTCGDKITIYLEVADDKIIQARYQGDGCAISQASTSMLTEKLIGLSVKEAQELKIHDIFQLLGVEINPGRIKCATIGLIATQKALKI